MQIPIRMVFKRAEEPGGKAQMMEADYAEVPDALVLGTLAKSAADAADVAGDEENAARIRGAMDAAARDGKLMFM